nr:MAG TPA: hypothetical protein [Caudoviricetes sp.]
MFVRQKQDYLSFFSPPFQNGYKKTAYLNR